MNEKTRTITTLAMFAAISVLLVALIRFPIFLDFLEYDPADIPIFIVTFAYGPWAGLILTVVVSVLQGLTVSAQSGVIGIIMHILATGSFVLVAGYLYRGHKTRSRAAVALLVGLLTMTAVMVLWNIIFTPLYTGFPREQVIGLILPAILPFNLIKGGINASVTFVLYKYVSRFIRGRAVKAQTQQ